MQRGHWSAVSDARAVVRAVRTPATRLHSTESVLPGSPRSSTSALRSAPISHPTLLETKLIPPSLGPSAIRRDGLLRLLATTDAAVVAVCAPAGYGKTTLLTQVAAAANAPVAWLCLDETDADAVQLLLGLTTALDRCVPLDPRVLQSLRNPTPALSTEVLPCL